MGTGAHARAGGCCGTGTAHAQTGVKVLVLKGADDATNRAAVTTIKQLGTDNEFTVDEAAGVADINGTKLAGYQALVFVNVAGDVLDSAGEAALQSYVEAGNGFLGIGSTATVEPGSSFVNGLIGARPSTNPTTPSAADGRPGRPRAPLHTRPAAAVEPLRPLVHVDDASHGHRPHRRALPRPDRGRR